MGEEEEDGVEGEEEEVSKTRLLVENVPWTSTADDLRPLFEKYGTVVGIEVSFYVYICYITVMFFFVFCNGVYVLIFLKIGVIGFGKLYFLFCLSVQFSEMSFGIFLCVG